MADNTAEIAEKQAILRAGVTSITVDGTTTQIDLNEIRRQLIELIRTDDTQGSRKPMIATIDVGGLM